MMLVGIPVFGTCLGKLSAYLFAEQREEIKLRLVKGGLTPEKLPGLLLRTRIRAR